VRVEGGYHEVAGCLNRLAQMDRIVHVSDLTLEPVTRGGLDEEAPAVQAHFFVTAYMLSGAEATAQQAEEAPGGLRGAVDRLVRGRSASAAGGGRSRAGGSDE
jgi:hypothetical protein